MWCVGRDRCVGRDWCVGTAFPIIHLVQNNVQLHGAMSANDVGLCKNIAALTYQRLSIVSCQDSELNETNSYYIIELPRGHAIRLYMWVVVHYIARYLRGFGKCCIILPRELKEYVM